MYVIDTLETAGLGNRSYLVERPDAAVVIDPPRDIDRAIVAAERRGAHITHVVETHVHLSFPRVPGSSGPGGMRAPA